MNKQEHFILSLWGVRCQVRDVSRSVAFYTQQLGSKLDMQTFRNQMEAGPGGSPIELFEPVE
jgi:catechol 2,3-dioxygenase-like lactoylglutathione lyase family enzyme